MMRRIVSCVVAQILLVVAAPAVAQIIDPRTCDQNTAACSNARRDSDAKSAADSAAREESSRPHRAEQERQRRALLKKPPLPAESNGLLGSWRLADGQQSSAGAGGLGREAGRGGLGDMVGILSSMNLDKLGCEFGLGGGITFGPSTYSRGGIDGRRGGTIAYRSARSGAKSFIAAMPDDVGLWIFEVASPDRIIDSDGCALVRVGVPGATAAASAATAPGNARAPAASRPALTVAASGDAGAVVDGAAFRCGDGSLLHVTSCQGNASDATCKLTELHLPGLQMGKLARRAEIAARVNGCEAGGIRYGADDKPVFVR